MKNFLAVMLLALLTQVSTQADEPERSASAPPIPVTPELVIGELIRLNQAFDVLNRRMSGVESTNQDLKTEITKLQHRLEVQSTKTENGFEIASIERKSGDELTLKEAQIVALKSQVALQQQLLALLSDGATARDIASKNASEKPNKSVPKKVDLQVNSTNDELEVWVMKQFGDMKAFEKFTLDMQETYRTHRYDKTGIPPDTNAAWTKAFSDWKRGYEYWRDFTPKFLGHSGVREILETNNLRMPQISPPFEARWQPLVANQERIISQQVVNVVREQVISNTAPLIIQGSPIVYYEVSR